MIDAFADILAAICILAGLGFMLIGCFGIVRLPDVYHRIHAASKCTTLGLMGLLLGTLFHVGTFAVFTKVVLIIIFAFVAAPVGSHMLAKAAHRDRAPQWEGTLSDELAQDCPPK